MRIATWNVNSIKQRLDHLLTFLKSAEPDVVCLQELKCVDEAFPRVEVEAPATTSRPMGRRPITASRSSPNALSRMSAAACRATSRRAGALHRGRDLPAGGVVRVASIYLPNGNPIGTPKFNYKLAWMDRLAAHAESLLPLEEPLVLCGDYNVIPEPGDAADPAAWVNDALFQPESRARFRALLHLGFTDAVRACSAEPGLYTFWDYQAGAFQRNNGIRIDHLLLSPQAADRLRRRRSARKPAPGTSRPTTSR